MRLVSELTGMNIVVYDCEIKNPIGGMFDGKPVTWGTPELMGISVACLFDYKTMDYMIFMDDNIAELSARLNNAHLIVAFNQIGFDNNLVRKNGGDLRPDCELFQYDMLAESRAAVGWSKNNQFPNGVKGRMKLDDHLLATFGNEFMKTAHGSEAPLMYQRKEIGRLASYCLADVTRERMLFEYIWSTGKVKTFAHGERTLRHPSELIKKV